MKPERYQQVKQIFAEVIACDTGERPTLLDRVCAGDEELRNEVESLLAHDQPAGGFIAEPAFKVTARFLAANESESIGQQRLGTYRILREIGRGGMGVVYLAERDDEQFTKRVAIKLIKRGMDTDAVLRRFLSERQILAHLEHPNIARLLDGGTTDDGLPYFVMEYVEGVILTRYCDEHLLSTDQRLKLFGEICAAIQYAHQNLVIHRDIKPVNILVTGEGVPKLLDFGIAKLLHSDASQPQAELTATALRVMTPEYASPEQVRGEQVSTATDVYSLGVVLYELLTGHRPYQHKGSSPDEISLKIRTDEPDRPSAAINRVESWSGKNGTPPVSLTPESVSATREGRPEKLRHRLQGDLDNIVLMAMRKDPRRRYSSVAQFSEDIRRHLAGLPVVARQDTFAYRAAKFIKRNRIAVAAASLILLTLLSGIIATTVQARRARAQAIAAQEQRDKAEDAQRRAEKLNAFMQSIFSYANPEWFGRANGRKNLSVLEAMRDIEKHIDTDFRDEPDLRADVYQQIGDAYRTQQLYADAERNVGQALRLRLELYGEDNAKVAESMYVLSGVRYQLGDLVEQERLLTQALAIQRRHPNDGNNLPYMMVDYATLLFEKKADYAAALALDTAALERISALYGQTHYMFIATRTSLARDYFGLGDYEKAETIILADLSYPEYRNHFLLLAYLARIRIIKGDYQAAQLTLQQMLADATAPEAPPRDLKSTYEIQSFMAYRQGNYARAAALNEKMLAVLPTDPGTRLDYAGISGSILNKLGQEKRAETVVRVAIDELNKAQQPGMLMTLVHFESILGESLTSQHRFPEARQFLLSAYETQKARVPPQQFDLIETRQRLVALYRAWGDEVAARKYE